MSTQIRFYPKLNVWKNSTGSITIDLNSGTIWSYDTKIGMFTPANKKGVLPKNGNAFLSTAKYSVTTTIHQSIAHRWLKENGYTTCCVPSIKISQSDYVIANLKFQITVLENKAVLPRIRKTTKDALKIEIGLLKATLGIYEENISKFNFAPVAPCFEL